MRCASAILPTWHRELRGLIKRKLGSPSVSNLPFCTPKARSTAGRLKSERLSGATAPRIGLDGAVLGLGKAEAVSQVCDSDTGDHLPGNGHSPLAGSCSSASRDIGLSFGQILREFLSGRESPKCDAAGDLPIGRFLGFGV